MDQVHRWLSNTLVTYGCLFVHYLPSAVCLPLRMINRIITLGALYKPAILTFSCSKLFIVYLTSYNSHYISARDDLHAYQMPFDVCIKVNCSDYPLQTLKRLSACTQCFVPIRWLFYFRCFAVLLFLWVFQLFCFVFVFIIIFFVLMFVYFCWIVLLLLFCCFKGCVFSMCILAVLLVA